LADRIILRSRHPGRIRNEIRIGLPRPRDADSPAVRALIDEVYGLMTMRAAPAPVVGAPSVARVDYRLPDTDVARIEAVLDLLAASPYDGRADLPQLSEDTEQPLDGQFGVFEPLGQVGPAGVGACRNWPNAPGRPPADADHAPR